MMMKMRVTGVNGLRKKSLLYVCQSILYIKITVKNQIKTQILNLVRTTRFWNNHNQISSKSKDWKAKYF